MESKICYLEMIQGVITRMASSSFFLKGWSVTLIVGIFALINKDTDKGYFLIAYVPIIVFWFLDSYYLQLERKYRALYNNVRTKNITEIDFSMDIEDVNISVDSSKKMYYFNCLTSLTEVFFYLSCAITVTIVIILF